jgi:MFS superfamily sulfate permease-like transporter
MGTFSNFKGDLAGGVTAAIISLPACIGYGIIVFAPLGVKYAPYGALLGL